MRRFIETDPFETYSEFEDMMELFDEYEAPPDIYTEFDDEIDFLEIESDDEWLGEINRKSRTYIKWVQRSLNQILGTRLAVDGIMGSRSRSAIRSFQRRAAITADGIIGAQTERALIAAGASPPPSEEAIVAPSIQSLKNNIISLANQEHLRWGKGTTKESNPRIRNTLTDYWRTGTGIRFTEPGWWSKYPWSAAFISWIMKKAGAGDAFRYSGAHAVYTKAAKNNRLVNNNNPFKAYRISEVKPRVGDLVCKSREGRRVTYENIRPGHKTHCDIVTAIQPNRLSTIGGNVSDSVSMTPVTTDANGYIKKPGYFAVIRIG